MHKSKDQIITIPNIGEGKRGEAGYIGYLLRQAHAAYRIRMERSLLGLGLTLPQFSVLTMLAAYPGSSGAELAKLSLLTPQTMSVIVGNLERDGTVTRHSHEVHGRIRVIEITDAGLELLARCKSAVRSVEKELLADVAKPDEITIRRWLVQVAKQLDAPLNERG
jgi:DNA-binding MarR family transcriptional regulator